MKATSMCILILYINTSIVFIHFTCTCTCMCNNYVCPSMVKLSDRFITSV